MVVYAVTGMCSRSFEDRGDGLGGMNIDVAISISMSMLMWMWMLKRRVAWMSWMWIGIDVKKVD